MKTIAMTLTALLCGAYCALAGVIWHPGLGNAPAGQVYISSDAQTYQFETTNGTELIYELEEMRSSLNRQLAADGISWITVSDLRSDTDEQFTVVLTVGANRGTGLRSAYFGTSGRRLELIQRGADDSGVTPDYPRQVVIIPGTPTDISLKGSNTGVWYTIRKAGGDSQTSVASLLGTGGPLTFRNVYFTSGEYWIENVRNGDFTVEYPDTFYVRFATDEQTCRINADGGVYRVYFDRFTERNGREVMVTHEDDLYIYLEGPFSDFMSGSSIYWNPKMRLTYGYDAVQRKGYISVTCNPNLSESEERRGDTFLLNSRGEHISFVQPEGGTILNKIVSYDTFSGTLYATVPQTQIPVNYQLIRDGHVLASGIGNGKDLRLQTPAEDGEYLVKASYEDGEFAQEIELNGATVLGGSLISLSDDRNWTLTTSFTSDRTAVSDITYYDGLGYPRQTVALHAVSSSGSGTVGDVVQQTEYDCWHREVRNYLPVVTESGNNGRYTDDFVYRQNEFYRGLFEDDSESMFAYTEKQYENSPLNRLRSACAPGFIYHDNNRAKRYIHDFNNEGRVLRIDAAADGSIRINGFYPQNTLFYDVATDEDGVSSVTYTDKTGRVVLESNYSRHVYDDDNDTDTYYVYDDLDRLVWVISPEGAAQLTDGAVYDRNSDFARKYCYTYDYDGWGRLISKRLPGREAEYMVYDAADRPAMSQDGNLRSESKWRLYRYDVLGRLLTECLVVTPESREMLQASFDLDPDNPPVYGLAGKNPFVADYQYDLSPTSSDLAFSPVTGVVAAADRDPRTTGLKTAETLAVIGDDIPTNHVFRAFYYDYKNRPVQTVQADPYGGLLRTSFRYDFAGNVLKRHERFTAPDIDDVLLTEFTYDNRGRLLSETATLNDRAPAKVSYAYNDLGQLVEKRYGSGNSATWETLEYNIQGWTTAKTSNLFDMRLRYYDPQHGAAAKYAGTIAEWEWQHKNPINHTESPAEVYAFTYDRLNRLTQTDHLRDNLPFGAFRETDFVYDRNGNIRSFARFEGNDVPRTYEFTYEGNLRKTAKSEFYSYDYDANGNLTRDPVSNLDMAYNFLNLPVIISGTENEPVLRYAYLADGTKFTVGDYDRSGLAYRGSLVYYQDFNRISGLESAAFGSGRITEASRGQEIGYFLTDHLGSTRVIVNDNSAQVTERNDYHPFGAVWQDAQKPVSPNRYKFSGKEIQPNDRSPYLDFGARFYDPVSVIWTGQDQLAEKYPGISPYAYCGNNPVKFVDPDGRKVYFAQGVAQDFKDKFAATVKYMNEKGTAGGIANLQASDNSYYIKEAGSISGTNFNPATNTISWDPNHLLQTDDEILVSPATVLAHEVDHAQKYDEVVNSGDNAVIQEYNNSVTKGSDDQYEKKEERRVIMGTEQKAARKHGDINKNQTTRTNHNGKQSNINISDMTPKEISIHIYESNNKYLKN